MSTMTKLVFPVRRRCLGCSRKLGTTATDPVLDGLHCSARCAGVSEPAHSVSDAPRECRTQHGDTWVFKRRYRCEEEIPDKLRGDPSTSWYRCSHCRHLHIGHSRMGEAEQLRVLRDPQALADFLIKRRGTATRPQVAAAAGIRPIRLKELEEPANDQRVDLQALFAVLAVLQAHAAVTIGR